LLFIPYVALFIFSLIVEHLRLHTIPVSGWVTTMGSWLPPSGFLFALISLAVARRVLARDERIPFIIYSIVFVMFITSPLIQSPRPQPKYRRLEYNALTLTLAAREYARTHNGSYPPHWAALLLSTWINPYTLIDTTMTPPSIPNPKPPEAQWRDLAPEVDAHSIFIYVAADLHDPALIKNAFGPSLDPAIIIAYTRPSSDTLGHRILLFAQGDPKLVPESDLPNYFAACNTARSALSLPPLATQQ